MLHGRFSHQFLPWVSITGKMTQCDVFRAKVVAASHVAQVPQSVGPSSGRGSAHLKSIFASLFSPPVDVCKRDGNCT